MSQYIITLCIGSVKLHFGPNENLQLYQLDLLPLTPSMAWSVDLWPLTYTLLTKKCESDSVCSHVLSQHNISCHQNLNTE